MGEEVILMGLGIITGLLLSAACSEPRKKYKTTPETIYENRKRQGLPPLSREEMQKFVDLIAIDKERYRVQRMLDMGLFDK